MIRRHNFYAGRVQGVGFRYTARTIARAHAVTGWVRNLPDRRVELVVEGEIDEIKSYCADLAVAMGGNIESTESTDAAATGEFVDFSIRE